MTSVSPTGHSDWKCLYTAAILETDKNVMAQRVLEAEQAILNRGREVFYSPATNEEQEALEDALYILRALRNASQRREPAHSSNAA
jgi:hypothetical protein